MRRVAVPLMPPTEQVWRLTCRERQVLKLVAVGLSDKEISSGLCRSTRTVQNHVKEIFRKLEINRRAVLVRFACAAGVIKLRGKQPTLEELVG